MRYTAIERVMPFLCDNGDPTSYVNVLYRPGVIPFTNQWEFACHQCSILNNSGSAVITGIGVRKAIDRWKVGSWTNATTTYLDKTSQAQNTTINDVPLETTTANDGFIVCCYEKFNLLDLLIGTAGSGTGPVHDFAYTKGDGTWITPVIANLPIAPPAAAHWAAAETLVLWDLFPDWQPSTGAEGTAMPAGMYAIRIRATTPPGTTAALANSMTVHMMTYMNRAQADATKALLLPISEHGVSLDMGEAASAFISTASIKNRIETELRARG